MLDNVVDVTTYPLLEQQSYARDTRRIGLGITGVGDALAMLGWRYGGTESQEFVGKVMHLLSMTAYDASVELAREKGSFPAFQKDPYLAGGFIQRLPESLRCRIGRYGIRNSHLIAIAPTGSVSLLANNVSSGIEPIFAIECERVVTEHDRSSTVQLKDYAYHRLLEIEGNKCKLGEFTTAADLSPEDHINVVAAAQPFVDNAISKTINLPADTTTRDIEAVFRLAYERKLKGCTVFRLGAQRGSILRRAGAS
jgi:ribonucleoside-diphosphate reductase alpha chain